MHPLDSSRLTQAGPQPRSGLLAARPPGESRSRRPAGSLPGSLLGSLPGLLALAAGLLLALAACGGTDPGTGSPAGSPSSAAVASTGASADAAAKAAHPYYRVTPIVGPASDDPYLRLVPSLSFVRLAEDGQVTGIASRGPDRSNDIYYWRPATGYAAIIGGPGQVRDINDHGVVAGNQMGGMVPPAIPYIWAPGDTSARLLGPDGLRSQVIGLSNDGLVIGHTIDPSAPGTTLGSPGTVTALVYWRADGSFHPLTLPGPEPARFAAINRAGVATGSYGKQPFLWSETTGIQLLPLPAGVIAARPFTIGEGGQLAGLATLPDGSTTRPFVWDEAAGLQLIDADLGPMDDDRYEYYDYRVSRAGAVLIASKFLPTVRAVYWSPGGGVRELITEQGTSGQARWMSPDGAVVGWYKGADEVQTAFVWTEAEGLADLNARIDPALGIHLEDALRLTDDGHIVAATSSSLVLLAPKPATPPAANTPPILGDIEADDVIPVATAFTVSARFTDVDAGDRHTASFDFGDDSGPQPGRITATGNGAWTVTGSHSYATTGVYDVTLTVADSAGAQVTATRKISVPDTTVGHVVGIGHFISEPGAYRGQPEASGRAEIAFVSRYRHGREQPSGMAALRFRAGNLFFRSSHYEAMTVVDDRIRITGTGKLNDEAGYRFTLTAIDGTPAGQKDRVRIEIVACDGSVRYDNQSATEAAEGMALGGGTVRISRRD